MKRIIIFVGLLLIPITLLGQLIRSGNLSSEIWDQNVQITSDATIGNGVTITINAGVTVELYSGVNLIISGTGTLIADASNSTSITFTAYDGISWGHLFFNNVTATSTSVLKNCIIEKGDVTSLSNSWGGGLNIQSNNVTLEKCIIRNNKAVIGGGIHVGSNISIQINECLIKSNIAINGGGGIHLYDQNTSEIINCIIDNNSVIEVSDLYGGGGILFGFNCYAAKVINCTLVNNYSIYGSDATFFGSNSLPKFVNSILWSNNPILYTGLQYLNSLDFTNCAIRSSTALLYTNCIELSATNNATNGPNFVATDGSDWSIKFISPCRDAGTSLNAPTSDYLGNNRIGNYDIGAYEVQYSRWRTTPFGDKRVWSDPYNWENNFEPGHTGTTGDIVIPNLSASNQPDGITATINSGKYLIMEPGAVAYFSSLTNNGGILNIQSDYTNISSLMLDSYSSSGGTTNISLCLTGGLSTLWHYISPPVSNIPTSIFSSVGARSVTRYEENLITNDLNNGWVNYEGYHYNSSTLIWEYNSGLDWESEGLVAGRGYNYNSSINRTFGLTGSINIGDVQTILYYNSGNGTPNIDNQGYNLIGNPYTCGINWDVVVSNNNSIIPYHVEPTIYFRKNGNTYYYNNGVTVPDDNGTLDGRYIPPTQGFFIKSNLNWPIILTIPATSKIHTSNPRYKSTVIIPLIRLQIDQSANSDQTVIRFDDNATLAYDNMFDARKAFSSTIIPTISSSLGGIDYAINGIPFPETSISIPVIFNAPGSGSYSISAKQLVGLENYKVTLKDNAQNIITDLSQGSTYAFSSSQGKFTDRFILTISNVLTPVPEITASKHDFNIYTNSGLINIQTLNDSWDQTIGEIKIVDLTGRSIFINKNYEFTIGNLIQVPVSFNGGIYIVEITSGYKRFVSKVVVK